jgi:hypothetical protein
MRVGRKKRGIVQVTSTSAKVSSSLSRCRKCHPYCCQTSCENVCSLDGCLREVRPGWREGAERDSDKHEGRRRSKRTTRVVERQTRCLREKSLKNSKATVGFPTNLKTPRPPHNRREKQKPWGMRSPRLQSLLQFHRSVGILNPLSKHPQSAPVICIQLVPSRCLCHGYVCAERSRRPLGSGHNVRISKRLVQAQ